MSALSGKYELGERLGGGGMADVFRATTRGAEGFSRPVAIKRIKRSISTDKGFATLFVSEARLAAKLHHPNVVQTLDFDRDEKGCFYLVMELIDGVDLRTLATSGRVPVSACCFVVSELLRALDYAHELVEDGHPITIIHRDISPHNIMLGWQGAVKVVDFGIAKAIEASLVSRSGSLKGKVAYMSPEQIHGHALDGRSDLFAVGIVLHELLTGARLFVGKSEAETLSKVLTQPIPSPRSMNDMVPPDIDAIVMRLLERDRSQRYTRARDALEELLDSSVSSTQGRRDLETILGERFPDRAPKRTTRLSQGASSSSYDALPVAVVSASEDASLGDAATIRAEVEPVAIKETVPNRPVPKPIPKRTFTAEPALTLGEAKTVAPAVDAEASAVAPAPAHRSRLSLVVAMLGVAAVAVAAVVLLDTGEKASGPARGLEVVAVHGATAADGAGDEAVARGAASGAVGVARTGSIADAGSSSGPVGVTGTGSLADAGSSSGVEPDAGSRAERAAKEKEQAVLTLSAKPWATIRVDGKSYGQTPQTIRLRRGKHRVVLENSGLDKRESFSVTLKPGQTQSIEKDWR